MANISHFKGTFENDFPIPQVGYVNSLEGRIRSSVHFYEGNPNLQYSSVVPGVLPGSQGPWSDHMIFHSPTFIHQTLQIPQIEVLIPK